MSRCARSPATSSDGGAVRGGWRDRQYTTFHPPVPRATVARSGAGGATCSTRHSARPVPQATVARSGAGGATCSTRHSARPVPQATVARSGAGGATCNTRHSTRPAPTVPHGACGACVRRHGRRSRRGLSCYAWRERPRGAAGRRPRSTIRPGERGLRETGICWPRSWTGGASTPHRFSGSARPLRFAPAHVADAPRLLARRTGGPDRALRARFAPPPASDPHGGGASRVLVRDRALHTLRLEWPTPGVRSQASCTSASRS